MITTIINSAQWKQIQVSNKKLRKRNEEREMHRLHYILQPNKLINYRKSRGKLVGKQSNIKYSNPKLPFFTHNPRIHCEG